MRKVTIIGAGFSGLVCAQRLVRAGATVEIIDRSSRTGGLISTQQTPSGLVESAANGLLNSCLLEELASEIGIELVSPRPEAKRRFIIREGRARRWPIGFRSTVRLGWFLLRAVFVRAAVAPRAMETMHAWATRVMGEEAARYLVAAGLQGIYAGDPARLSASLILSRFFSSGAKPPRPSRRGTVAPSAGMGALMHALEKWLRDQGVVFRLEADLGPTDVAQIARPLIIATGAPEAARLLRDVRPSAASVLSAIKMLPITTCTLFFPDTDDRTQGFGCLFAPSDRAPALGVLKNDFIFENRAASGLHSETWIFGGAFAPADLMRWSDQRFLDEICQERRRVFNVEGAAVESRITRWPAALPHYTTELEAQLHSITPFENGVGLIGNYLGSIGLAQILARADALVKNVMKEISTRD